jgi:16S rRNA processing protein RimM
MPDQPQPAARGLPTRSTAGRAQRLNVAVPAGFLAVAYVVGVHGMRGEVKAELYTDFPERFTPGLTLRAGEELQEIEVRAARLHKQHILLSLAGVTTREQAEALRGRWLFVAEDDAVLLEEGTYFVHDILGLEVVTEEGEALGAVADVIFTGANEVYVVRRPAAGDEPPPADLLLPATDEVVRSVDLDAGRMVVRLLPGLTE